MGVPILGGQGLLTQGKSFFVRPRTGSDGNSGTKINEAFKTLTKAHSMCTAGQNDVVYLVSEGNSASDTTDYQSTTLVWSKNNTHLVGISASARVGHRARIAQLSTATGVAPLMTISGSSCIFKNFSVFHGVDDATSIGAVNVTGSRNYFENVNIAGIGHATMDVENNYSLQISAGQENTFVGCTIGLDTIARGTAANSEIRLVSGATRNEFIKCNVVTYAEANTHQFLLVPVNGLDRYTIFDDCIFMNMPTGVASGTTMTEAFDITGGGSPDGLILLKNCALVGATDWEANTESAKTYIFSATSTNNTAGLAVLVEAT